MEETQNQLLEELEQACENASFTELLLIAARQILESETLALAAHAHSVATTLVTLVDPPEDGGIELVSILYSILCTRCSKAGILLGPWSAVMGVQARLDNEN